MSDDTLDAAYDRLLSTGPEFDGWLSNHGPMAAEALTRHGHADDVSAWLDTYCRRLEPAPTFSRRIDDWRGALGNPRQLGDWLGYFDEQLRRASWNDVLATWWPRLIPGIAAGATHGVIRVGHAVRALREAGATEARIAELAQGLGYWAARWQPVPGAAVPSGQLSASDALAALPRIHQQDGGIAARLAQLDTLDDWSQAQGGLRPHDDWQQFLREVVTAAVHRYATHAHGDAIMLVHAATSPNAVLRTLPSLPRELWQASSAAAWSASAAVHAAYAPEFAADPSTSRTTAVDAFERAVRHGDEHVIKFADTALDAYAWGGGDGVLAAIETAVTLVEVE